MEKFRLVKFLQGSNYVIDLIISLIPHTYQAVNQSISREREQESGEILNRKHQAIYID